MSIWCGWPRVWLGACGWLACHMFRQLNLSLMDFLNSLYARYGYHAIETKYIVINQPEIMNAVFANLRAEPSQEQGRAWCYVTHCGEFEVFGGRDSGGCYKYNGGKSVISYVRSTHSKTHQCVSDRWPVFATKRPASTRASRYQELHLNSVPHEIHSFHSGP